MRSLEWVTVTLVRKSGKIFFLKLIFETHVVFLKTPKALKKRHITLAYNYIHSYDITLGKFGRFYAK